MKEIKVRVFDLDGSKMSAGVDIEQFMANDCELEFPDTDESLPLKDFLFFRKEHSDFMLSTGIQDKNKKEIFEGDVIKTEKGDWGVIVWKTPFFEVTVSENQSSMYSREWFATVEVIGNIYQNPELIKIK